MEQTFRFTVEMLVGFGEAWNRHDMDAIMSFMSEDCIFEASGGPYPYGSRYQGAAAVRAAFEAMLKANPDAQFRNSRHFIAGDRGVTQWLFTSTAPDGSSIEVEGIDVFTFRGERILVKNAFRKDRRDLSLRR